MRLQSQMEPAGWIDWCLLVIDMIVQPVILFVSLCVGWEVSTFSIASGLLKSAECWWSWCRYQVLRDLVRHWILVTKLAGGPFISCNDPTYHVFVYADAIERLRLGLCGRSGLTQQRLGRVSTSKEGLEAR